MRRADRVAVLADIHGNLPALEAVLTEVDAAGVDLVVLDGDIVTGPHPRGTLALLEARGDRTVWVRGNADRELTEPPAGAPVEVEALRRWVAGELDVGRRQRLAALPLAATVVVEGLGQVLCCHATARDDTEIVLVDSSLDRYQAAFAGVTTPTVVLGHTHMPFDRLVDRRRFLNAGSVGMPYGHAGASWVLLGPGVELRRTAYDVEAAAARLREGGYPGIEDWLQEYLFQQHSDAEALRVFSAAAGGSGGRTGAGTRP
jgi:putative phosphoesterase